MDTIRNWAFSLCCASIAGGILNFLLPKSNLQKTYKTVFCVFFLCIMLAPLSEIDFHKMDFWNFGIFDSEENFYDNEFNDFSAEYIEREILLSVEKILESEKISAENILIKINISEEGSIDINEFALILKDSEKSDYIVEKIYRETGILPEILISGAD